MNIQVSIWLPLSRVIFIAIILAYSHTVIASSLFSDDFNAATSEANPSWRFYDPYDTDGISGNESGESTLTYDEGNALIGISSGLSHDLWAPSKNSKAPRLLQAAPNTDFQFEVKFETEAKIKHQLQGIIVQQTDDIFLRFDIFYNVSGIAAFVAYVDNTTSGNPIIHHGPTAILTEFPNYQQVIRSGDNWTFRYSANGLDWTDVNFTQSMTVSEVGVFAGTAALNPEFLSSIDYFIDLDDELSSIDVDTWTPPPSPPPIINTWYAQPTIQFGQAGISQKWANILGNVSSEINIATLSYTINDGSTQSLAFGSSGFDYRLEKKGDFNIEIDHTTLFVGPNTIVIEATDSDDQVTSKTITIDYAPAGIGLPPYSVDWDSLESIQEVESVAHIVDGLWDLSVNGGIRTVETGYDRAIAIGDETWLSDNYEVTVPFTPHSNFSGIGFGIGWQGHEGVKSPKIEWPLQSLAWVRGPINNPSLEVVTYGGLPSNTWEVSVGTHEELAPLIIDQQYMLKSYSEPLANDTSRFHVKFWTAGEGEPSDWNIQADVPTRDGSVLLVAYKGDVTFGNVSIVPVTSSPDSIPPIISNIQATVTNSTATISWETDKPSNSVVDYGLSNNFDININDSARVTSHSLTLTGLNTNTLYHYRVKSSDSNNNTTVSSEDLVFTTSASTDTISPVISNVQVSAVTHSTATITWETDELSNSIVNYGLNANYGSITDDVANVVLHSLSLENLVAGTSYHYQVISKDTSNNITTSEDFVFTTNNIPASPSGMVSDDFNGDLNTSLWTFYDPVGDSSISVTGTQAAISVPAGSSHDLWKNNLAAPRIRQAANNTDFKIEAKFDSPLSAKYQLQGFTVEQDTTNLIRFGFYNDGSVTRIFSANFVNGIPSVRIQSVITGGNSLYIRVMREGDQWTESYSFDGINWVVAGVYTHNIMVTSVAIFGGNAGNTPPAHTALIDYFKVDGIPPVIDGNDIQAPLISNSQVIVTDTTATITWETNEVSDSKINYGIDANYGLNFTDLADVISHSLTLTNLEPNTEYHYQINTTDPDGNLGSSVDKTFITDSLLDSTAPEISNVQVAVANTTATITWNTNEVSDSVINYGLNTSYGATENNSSLVTEHSVSLTGLEESSVYHYQVVSTDGVSNSGNSADLTFTTIATNTGNNDWWNNNWNYRASLTVNSGGYARSEKPVEVVINFTSYLATVDQTTAFDENSIRVHEIDINGTIITENIPFQFDSATDFDATTNAQGTLVFLLSDNTASQTDRYFQVYFDVEGGGYRPSIFTSQVNVTDNVFDEGQSSFLIESDNAAYYYQKQAGGFSSLVDNDGNDWISYHPEVSGVSGSANQFRGLPNLVFPEGHFHPGSTNATSTLLHDGVLKATIESVTNDGLWKVQWEFFPKFSRMTVNLAEKNFWFLYEGTPGGTLDTSDFVMRSNGVQNSANASWISDINDPEWLYFSDPNIGSGRSLFLAHHNDDSEIDSYRPMDSANDLQMTVFGFGRSVLNSLINKNQTHQFTIGLTDSTDFANTSATIESAYNTITAVITANDLNPETSTDSTPPVVSAINTVVTDTTATITWTTDEPSSGVVNYGTDNSYGVNATDTNTSLGGAHSVTISGLTAETEYHFEVVSADGSSNSSVSPDRIFTTAAIIVDNTPPVASAINKVVTETTAVITWITDEPSIGVVNYGINNNYGINVADTNMGLATVHSVTLNNLTAATEYHFEVVSTDGSSNSSMSQDHVLTTNIPPGTGGGLVAHWSLREGAGITVNDNTANGHDGTLVNEPIWSGNELIFDGVNDHINAGSFDISGEALTLTGWVKSDYLGNCGFFKDCRIVSKASGTSEQDHYWMISTIRVGSTTRLRFRLKAGGSTSTLIASSGNLTSGELFHVAATYDGTTMRLYKDGVEVGSLAKSGSLDVNNTVNIWIGDNPPVSGVRRPWKGLIADIRIYQKALTAMEVNAVKDIDTNTVDTTPPTIIGTVNTVIIDTSVTLTWSTDELSTSTVNYGGSIPYSNTDETDSTLATSHSVTLSGLALDTEYHFEIVSTDGSTNSSTSPDQTFTTSIAADITSPVVSNIQTTVTDTTAIISWTTDEPASGAVNYGADNSYGANAVDTNTILATFHSVTLRGLTAETEYHFEVVSTDGSTNSSNSPDQILITTTAPSVNVGLVAHWSLDEGSGATVSDNTGNSHDGTLINGPIWNSSDLVFDGANDYVTVGSFDIPGEALTLTGWIKSDNLGSCSSYRDCRIVSKASGTSEQDHYWMISTIKVGGTTRLRFRLKAGGSTSTLIASSGNLTNGELFHVAATYDGATMRLYKDGVEVGSLTKTGSIDVNNSVDVWIGDNPSVAGTRPWKGVISDVRIYQTALTEVEVNTIKDLNN